MLPRAALAFGRVASDTRGAVMTEYLVLLGFVGLGVAAAIVGLGPTLLSSYERARSILVSPMP